MAIDFTTTACCRPEIIRRTYTSFLHHLKGFDPKESTLYLNIDRLPADADPNIVVRATEPFFKRVVPNTPNNPNFPGAVKWCWMQPQTKYFFHLEDDWVLNRDVDINHLINLLENRPESLACIILRAYPIRDDRICLSPGLWRSDYAKILAERLTLDWNPEQQLRPTKNANPHGNRHIGYIGRQWPDDINISVVSDIGREWLSQSAGYRKNKGHQFTTWVQSHAHPVRHGKTPAVVIRAPKSLMRQQRPVRVSRPVQTARPIIRPMPIVKPLIKVIARPKPRQGR